MWIDLRNSSHRLKFIISPQSNRENTDFNRFLLQKIYNVIIFKFKMQLKRNPKFIFFDLGGVIFNRKEPIHFSILKELGIRSDDYEKTYLDFIAQESQELKEKFKKLRTIKDQIEFFNASNRELCKYFGIEPNEELISRMTKHALKGDFYFLEKVEFTLEELKKNYRMGAITNALPSRRENEIKDLGLDKYLEVIVISKETDFEKPNPEIYKYAAKQAGVKEKEMLFVDDILKNLDGAVKAGVDNVVLVSDDCSSKKYPCVKNISELIGLLDEARNRK